MAAQIVAGQVSALKPVRATAGRSFFQGQSLRAAAPRVARQQRQLTTMRFQYDAVGAQYAAALVDLAQEKNNLDAVHADVDALSTLLRESPDVKSFLDNPIIAPEKKRNVIQSIGKEAGLNADTITFLNLVLDKDRLMALEEICESFEKRYCQLTDTQVAVVRSPSKLEQEQTFLVAKKLQELTGSKNIKMKPVIDESLIAGFIIEYGSSQIDMSVKGQLDKISQELENASFAF